MWRLIKQWWDSLHECDYEILEHDNAGYVSKCKICGHLLKYP